MEITRAELKEIERLNKELKMWNMALIKAESEDVKGKDRAIERNLYMKTIKGIVAQIELQRNKVISYIAGIDNSEMRQIMYLKCVSNLNWYEIGELMEIAAESARNKYYKYLKKQKIN